MPIQKCLQFARRHVVPGRAKHIDERGFELVRQGVDRAINSAIGRRFKHQERALIAGAPHDIHAHEMNAAVAQRVPDKGLGGISEFVQLGFNDAGLGIGKRNCNGDKCVRHGLPRKLTMNTPRRRETNP